MKVLFVSKETDIFKMKTFVLLTEHSLLLGDSSNNYLPKNKTKKKTHTHWLLLLRAQFLCMHITFKTNNMYNTVSVWESII